jgi:integrase/recombinase XerD
MMNNPKKLALSKETLRSLDDEDLTDVVGGSRREPGPRNPGRRRRQAPAEPRALFATASGRRLFAADVWRIVRRLAAQAGLPDAVARHLGPEAMRHSFATLYLDAGGSLGDLQKVMGHADPRTTRRYDRARQLAARSPGDVVAAYLAARQHANPLAPS